MAKIEENSRVHVPAKSLDLGYECPSAMIECRFRGVLGQKGIVDDVPRKEGEFAVDIRLISRKLGFLIVQLGDFETEDLLLEPLHHAVATATELVLMPEYVWKCRVRSIEEFRRFWTKMSGVVSHLVLVGHGSKTGLTFGDKNVEAREFIDALNLEGIGGQAPTIISLCCKSGNGIFGKALPGNPCCRAFIGPSGSIHAANASLFYQSFIAHSLLEGLSSQRAYQIARVFTPGVTEFNMWRKTNLVHKSSRKKVLGYK